MRKRLLIGVLSCVSLSFLGSYFYLTSPVTIASATYFEDDTSSLDTVYYDKYSDGFEASLVDINAYHEELAREQFLKEEEVRSKKRAEMYQKQEEEERKRKAIEEEARARKKALEDKIKEEALLQQKAEEERLQKEREEAQKREAEKKRKEEERLKKEELLELERKQKEEALRKESDIKENLLNNTDFDGEIPTESPRLYTLDEFLFKGRIHWGPFEYTYYSQSVLPGGGLSIPGRHVSEDGYVCDKDDFIVLAGSAPKGSIYPTPFGKWGKIYDRGTYGNHLDVYIR